MLIQIAIVLAFDWWQIPVNIIVLILAGWQIVPALLVVLLILDATASLYEKSSEPISSFTYNWQRGSFSPLCKTLKIKIKTLSRSWMKISDHNVYQSGGGLNNKNGL